jgi:hypothetical protein
MKEEKGKYCKTLIPYFVGDRKNPKNDTYSAITLGIGVFIGWFNYKC